jgi:hypothetical protein
MRRDLRGHVVVNRVERRALELAARDAGRSPSEYVRELVRAALRRVYRFILLLPARRRQLGRISVLGKDVR